MGAGNLSSCTSIRQNGVLGLARCSERCFSLDVAALKGACLSSRSHPLQPVKAVRRRRAAPLRERDNRCTRCMTNCLFRSFLLFGQCGHTGEIFILVSCEKYLAEIDLKNYKFPGYFGVTNHRSRHPQYQQQQQRI